MTFDTLKAYTRLRESGFDERQARALVELISEAVAVRDARVPLSWPHRDPLQDATRAEDRDPAPSLTR
jgi:hypothetical protein